MKRQNAQIDFKPKSRKHLNADALFKRLHIGFSKVSDCRQGDIDIAMADALMSGLGMGNGVGPSQLIDIK